MAKATKGNNAQFTYDFGIAIAQSTISKVTRLTGATISLAAAYHALTTTSAQYVSTLRENTLHFGGVLSTMKAMEQAQDRLAKGMSYFSMDDQLAGMRKLMNVGVKVGDNMEFLNKAAHAMGKSYSEFSGAIAQGIQGNMGALVEMGLLTQRSTKLFEKYGANTVMRQQAILNFVKQHKGLQSAIRNDFDTIQDSITRIKGLWQGFLLSVIGKPNDPSSFYGQVMAAVKGVTDAIARNYDSIKRIGQGIGMVLGWVVRQAGKFVTWIGKLVKRTLGHIWESSDSFVEWCRSLVVWLEFWKLKIIDFFKTYKKQIIILAATIAAFKLLKWVMPFGRDSLLQLFAYKKEFTNLIRFMDMKTFGFFEGIGKLIKFNFLKKSKNRQFLELLGLDPTKVGMAITKLFGSIGDFARNPIKSLGGIFKKVFLIGIKFGKTLVNLVLNLPRLIGAAFNALRAMWTALNATNPVGWVILAITALVILYKKCEGFRKLINGIFQVIIQYYKMIWNAFMLAYAGIRVGLQKAWGAIKGAFAWIIEGIKTIWGRIMNGKFGQWINNIIVEPIKGVFEWLTNALDSVWEHILGGVRWICDKLGLATDWLGNAAQDLAAQGGFKVKTFDASQYTDDGTDYLNKDNWGFGSNKGNPMDAGAAVAPIPIESSGPSTQMTFSNGAIQINIAHGENLDEEKLARKIREVILDTNRDMAVRGGYA